MLNLNKTRLVDEAQNEGNVDAWLDGSKTLELKSALKFLREEYLTTLGSNAKSFTPT